MLAKGAYISSRRQANPIITYGRSKDCLTSWHIHSLTDNLLGFFSLPLLLRVVFFIIAGIQSFYLFIFFYIWEFFSLSILFPSNIVFFSSILIAVERYFIHFWPKIFFFSYLLGRRYFTLITRSLNTLCWAEFAFKEYAIVIARLAKKPRAVLSLVIHHITYTLYYSDQETKYILLLWNIAI